MLTALVLLGGDSTKWFSMALLIGVICGVYSSTGVAIPTVLFIKKLQTKKTK
jgi:preprotein translocase subunit SecF/SecD/SecF fusion protein